MRILFSNEIGDTPLVIGGATVALATSGDTVAGPLVPLTFDGRTPITIQPAPRC